MGLRARCWLSRLFGVEREMVDLERFELSTSSMPWKRAPNCATGPREVVIHMIALPEARLSFYASYNEDDAKPAPAWTGRPCTDISPVFNILRDFLDAPVPEEADHAKRKASQRPVIPVGCVPRGS